MKRTFLKVIFISVLLSGFLSSCKEKEKEPKPPVNEPDHREVTFNSQLVLNNENVFEGNVLSLQNNYDMNISLFRFYLSHIKLVSIDNDTVEVSSVEILDPGSRLDNKLFKADVDTGKYKFLLLSFGLDPEQNNSDPNDFPNEHPLSSYETMIWPMIKYRFAKFEAKVNEPGQLGENDILVSLHPGTDEVYRSNVSYSIDLDINSIPEQYIDINVDMNELVAGDNAFNWNTERMTHSEGAGQLAIAAKFMDNLKAATSVEVVTIGE